MRLSDNMKKFLDTKDNRLELLMIAVGILFIFTLFDFTYCLVTYGVITNHNSLSYQIITLLIPALFIISVIVKIFRWNVSFSEIIWDIYTPLLFWGILIGFTLPLSLVFAAICKGIMVLDLFI
ncbi:hypothetical protein [Methanobrevibacter sp.]|uniref:hypothetical protein n=1 Tax=Methanobrevibacter sp. TaxID=66852 RepID=UPI00386E7B12